MSVNPKKTIANLNRDNLALKALIVLQNMEIDKCRATWAEDAWRYVELKVQLDGVQEALAWKALK